MAKMTNDEVERAIEFVVKQQAQFATDLQKLTQAHSETEKTLSTVVGLLGQVAETQLQMAEAQTDIAKAQKRTDEALTETNERLNALIVVVERYFSNGQHGNR